MNRSRSATILAALCCVLFWAVAASAQNGQQAINLKMITGGAFRPLSAGGSIRSTPDGLHYTEANRAHTEIIRYEFATGKAGETLFAISKSRNCSFKSFDDYIISPDANYILFLTDVEPIYRRSSTASAFVYDVRRNLVKPLSEQGGRIMIPTFSPDSKMVAFVRDNNIFIKKFDFDTEVQVTADGLRNNIINGATDWVYEEEFGQTNLMAWSPDAAFLTYVRTDESKVPTYTMPFYLGNLYPKDYAYKYPTAGQNNSLVSLYLYNIVDRSTKNVDLGLPQDSYIPRISFTTKADELAVFTLNRTQNNFRLLYVNPRSLTHKLILEDKNERYIAESAISSMQFLPSGFAYLAERGGWQHIYLYSSTGVQQRKVTDGEFDVTELYGVDSKGNVYYQSAEENPIRRAVYRMDPQGQKTKLSQGEGTNDAIFSSSFAYYINTFSNSTTPPIIALYTSQKPQKPVRILEENEALKSRLKTCRFAEKEFITLQTPSGLKLNAWIAKPKDFDQSKKYPLLMLQYSGPNSQQVLDRYEMGWENYLPTEGFIVACVDGRGTGARGEEFRKCTYMELGVRESDDQISAAKALGALPYIDESRMAIWGWSFGGYNTLMCMTRGNETFKVGIAVAPVTDWRYYDTIYTERYMRTPQENPEGYRKASVMTYAKGLKGKLLMVHGSADDNVHLRNVMDLSESFVQSGIPFDMAVYTDKNHGIYGGNTRYHLYSRMTQYLMDNL